MKRQKRWITFICILAVIISCLPAKAQAAGPKVQAHAYYMIDAGSGEKILSKKANKKIYPASTAKLMTALVVLEIAEETDQYTFTKKLKKKVPGDASALNLRTGRKYTVNQYLHMLLIASDASSAITLACGSAGTVENFVEWMNQKAVELDMTHTSFDNPIGLDIGSGYYKTYTTAADFIKLSKAAMENSTIRSIVSKKKYRVSPIGVNKSFVIKNTNAFYHRYKKMVKGKSYEIIGSKTGTTRAAGHCLVCTARDADGREVICAFYGKGDYKRLYKDVRKLMDYAYAH